MRITKKCDKPFPRRCPECGKAEVQLAVIAYDAQVNHDGRVYSFRIPQLHVNKCGACGDVLFDNLTDDEISQALREHLNLLSPEQIRKGIQALGLMQKEFAERISVAPETISRWLSGAYIQSRAMDKLMRMFFEREAAKPQRAPAM
jgi:putative zinc finger/helix-turn-helix YgiT family protein